MRRAVPGTAAASASAATGAEQTKPPRPEPEPEPGAAAVSKERTMEKSSSQFDSFLFWRQPIPALHPCDLQDLGLTDYLSSNHRPGQVSKMRNQDQDADFVEFSSFNYWRAPIADVDALLADLNLLL